MNRLLSTTLVATLLTFWSSGFALAGPYEDGMEALAHKDYAGAKRLWKLLEQQGTPQEQLYVAVLYQRGDHVPQDYREAMKWYRLAAVQNDLSGMYNLGAMYLKGEGVPQDYVRAHMWLNLSSSTANGPGGKLPAEVRDQLATKMTPQQIAEAQAMARKCQASNFKQCD